MPAKRQKTAHVSIYVAPELKAAATKAAHGDGVSLTRAIETLLERYCHAKGVTIATEPAQSKPRKTRK